MVNAIIAIPWHTIVYPIAINSLITEQFCKCTQLEQHAILSKSLGCFGECKIVEWQKEYTTFHITNVTWMQGSLHAYTMITLSCTVSVQKIQEGLPCRMLYFESKYLRLIMVCFITVGVLLLICFLLTLWCAHIDRYIIDCFKTKLKD